MGEIEVTRKEIISHDVTRKPYSFFSTPPCYASNKISNRYLFCSLQWTCVHDLQDPLPDKSGSSSTTDQSLPPKRLMYYTKEPTDGRGYIKELSVSPDGRLICSSYGYGIRLLAFDSKCSELCDIQPQAVRELQQVKFLVKHKSTVLTSRFSPTHCLLASGSMCGRVAFYHPKL